MHIQRRPFLLFAILALSSMASAQVKVTPYGFVRTYLNFDTRKTFTAIGGEYNMMPYDEEWNADHSADLNAVPHAQLQAFTTRVGLQLEGPSVWGMESGGKVEVDFGGFGTTNSLLRIRHAYIRLANNDGHNRMEYLAGQAWHPLCGDIMPDVIGMASGAPFRPHSRAPQIRATGYRGRWGFTAAMLYQLQFMNNGPASATNPESVASIDFASNAILPEGFLGINYKHGGWYAQAGVDAQVIRPRTHAIDPMDTAVVKKVEEFVGSITPTVYAQYEADRWSIKGRVMLAQNTSHLNQPVGYAVTGVNYIDGSWVYTPMRSAIGYLNAAYGQRYKLNLFLGYLKNLGCSRPLHDFGDDGNPIPSYLGGYLIYMKGGTLFTGLNSVWRIAPSFCYNAGAFSIGIEYELTGATYGKISSNGSIKLDDTLHHVINHRLCTMVKYNF